MTSKSKKDTAPYKAVTTKQDKVEYEYDRNDPEFAKLLAKYVSNGEAQRIIKRAEQDVNGTGPKTRGKGIIAGIQRIATPLIEEGKYTRHAISAAVLNTLVKEGVIDEDRIKSSTTTCNAQLSRVLHPVGTNHNTWGFQAVEVDGEETHTVAGKKVTIPCKIMQAVRA